MRKAVGRGLTIVKLVISTSRARTRPVGSVGKHLARVDVKLISFGMARCPLMADDCP